MSLDHDNVPVRWITRRGWEKEELPCLSEDPLAPRWTILCAEGPVLNPQWKILWLL